MQNLGKYLASYVASFSLIILFVTSSRSVSAQAPWLIDSVDNSIGIEIMKPIFDADLFSFLSTAQIISGRLRVSDAVLLAGELPFANISGDFNDSEFAIGNPYLGVIVNNKQKSYFLEAGLRVPLISENNDASEIGISSDFNRAEAYRSNYFTISAKNHYLNKNDSDAFYKLMGGLSYWIPKDDSFRDESELLFDYSTHVGYDGSKYQILGGLSGRMIITEDDASFSERTVHHFDLSARYKSNNFQPGVQFRMPLDDQWRDFIDYIVGVNALIFIN